jgi:peptide/nickel transport system substrate-binding protein
MDPALIGRRALLSLALHAAVSHALARKPYGGALRLELPLSMDEVDPHANDDPFGALFAQAVADPLFAWDAAGRPYPALAASLPEAAESGARVVLRPGLVTGRGVKLTSRDVVASLERARSRGARALLSRFGAFRPVRGDPLAVVVEGATPAALAEALASPCTALVPRAFNPTEPDGTGPFRATRGKDGFVFERSDVAARGPSFLDRVELRRAADLAAGLRAFETGDADVGFLGAGLHGRRPHSVDFHTESFGWFVLRTGPLAGGWGSPGVAARLVAGIERGRFSHLGIAPAGGGTHTAWGGPPSELLVDDGSAYSVEIAGVVAAALSAPGHEIRLLRLPHGELRKRRDEGKYVLAVDFVRKLGLSRDAAFLSLLAGADPKLAERPPHFASTDPGDVTRTLPLAILGELAVSGARVPELRGVETWDLGGIVRAG